MKCSKNHKHQGLFIVNEVEEHNEKWRVLKNELASKFPQVKEVYQRLEPLILYLENAMLSPNANIKSEVFWISKAFKSYERLHSEFMSFYDN